MSIILKRVLKGSFYAPKLKFLETVRYFPALRKRFYKNVHVTESDGKFEICLDKRKLKTPLGNPFQLPNEALAIAVATEWDTQRDVLQQQNMHITSLCNTALDNPCGQNRESLSESALQYLVSDTLCFRSTEPQDLVTMQNENWNPILQWFESRYKIEVNVCDDISGTTVSEKGIQEMKKQLLSYNDWCLIGMNFAAENLKSLILTFSIITQRIDVEKAVYLSRLETIFQANRWGNIEWSHDVDKAQTTSRVAAAILFVYLNEGSSKYVEKLSTKKVSSKVQVTM